MSKKYRLLNFKSLQALLVLKDTKIDKTNMLLFICIDYRPWQVVIMYMFVLYTESDANKAVSTRDYLYIVHYTMYIEYILSV